MTLFSRTARALKYVSFKTVSTQDLRTTEAQNGRFNMSYRLNRLGPALYGGAMLEVWDLKSTPFEFRNPCSLDKEERNRLYAFYCREALLLNPKNKEAIASLVKCIETGAPIELSDLKGTVFQLRDSVPTTLNEKRELINALKIKYSIFLMSLSFLIVKV